MDNDEIQDRLSNLLRKEEELQVLLVGLSLDDIQFRSYVEYDLWIVQRDIEIIQHLITSKH
jgi:hypothetical protein